MILKAKGCKLEDGFTVMLVNTPLAIVFGWIMASYISYQVVIKTGNLVLDRNKDT
jgi:hypothetical protein